MGKAGMMREHPGPAPKKTLARLARRGTTGDGDVDDRFFLWVSLVMRRSLIVVAEILDALSMLSYAQSLLREADVAETRAGAGSTSVNPCWSRSAFVLADLAHDLVTDSRGRGYGVALRFSARRVPGPGSCGLACDMKGRICSVVVVLC